MMARMDEEGKREDQVTDAILETTYMLLEDMEVQDARETDEAQRELDRIDAESAEIMRRTEELFQKSRSMK